MIYKEPCFKLSSLNTQKNYDQNRTKENFKQFNNFKLLESNQKSLKVPSCLEIVYISIE